MSEKLGRTVRGGTREKESSELVDDEGELDDGEGVGVR